MATAKDTRIKKGEVRNPKGRPKGSKNKATTKIRNLISDLVEKEFENVDELLLQLKPNERAKFLTDLLKYALPALSSVDMTATVDNRITSIEVKYNTKENNGDSRG